MDYESYNGYTWNYFSDSSSGRSSTSTSSPDFNVHRKYSLDQRFQKFDLENFAGNYFKPRRATELLLQAREDATKSINKWKDCIQQCKSQKKIKELFHENELILPNTLKSKQNPQDVEINNRCRSWTGQSSPITWMTGNVRVSPEMLPKKTSKIDLLPLIREKRNSFERL